MVRRPRIRVHASRASVAFANACASSDIPSSEQKSCDVSIGSVMVMQEEQKGRGPTGSERSVNWIILSYSAREPSRQGATDTGGWGGCVYTWCMSFTLGVNPCTLALSNNYKNLGNTLRETRGN